MINEYLVGDCIEVLRTLPDEIVQTVVTSPPYWGLRTYGEDGQYGFEPTPEEHITKMVEVFREVRRVLRSDGTVFLNYGDSYASTSGEYQDHNATGKSTLNQGQFLGVGTKHVRMKDDRKIIRNYPNLKPKDLCMIPARVAIALQADGWWLRSDIIWAKPNPMPESCTDRPTSSYEHIFLLAKNSKYFYDADAVREKAEYGRREQPENTWDRCKVSGERVMGSTKGADPEAGRNLRNVWTADGVVGRLRKDLTPEKRQYVVSELLKRGLI